MNKIILNNEDYTFNSDNKTITIENSIENFNKEFLLIVTNVTTNTIIYNFGCDGFGGTIENNVLTLEYDTSSMSSSDNLQIILYTVTNLETSIQIELLNTIKNNTTELNKIKELIKQTNKLLNKIYQ
jgi:hypothetical protein